MAAWAGHGFGTAAVLFTLWGMAPSEASGETGDAIYVEELRSPDLHIAGLPGAGAVRLAVLGAQHRLERGKCREIFSEFSDPAGHPLQARLDALGQTAQSYLEWIRFEDGEGYGRCRLAHEFAFTVPNSRVVFICGQKFMKLRSDISPLTVTILHEELHSLGLSENPPSSDEISRRVASKCQ